MEEASRVALGCFRVLASGFKWAELGLKPKCGNQAGCKALVKKFSAGLGSVSVPSDPDLWVCRPVWNPSQLMLSLRRCWLLSSLATLALGSVPPPPV
jgi:hypothetical protein